MNLSTIDLTVDVESTQLLPDNVFAETVSRTISNRKAIASRQILLAESDGLMSLADTVLSGDCDKVDRSSFEVFEDDLPDVTPAV